MLNKKLNSIGKITIERGQITVEGFGGDDCMCREVAILAMMYGIDELWREVQATIEIPGGTGRCGIG